ncbi:hypothetical protein [Streptomyces triculaminicus]|uniref:hypothetical protein n=1 Tax=Streptomyces triculaminicus TaxID=2816232 RepID=UPI0037D3E543
MGAWDKRNRRRRRLVLVGLRLLLLAAAAYGLLLCPSWVEEKYQGTKVYRNAPLCTAAQQGLAVPADDCREQLTGRVVDKATRESCTTDSNGVSSCTTDYDVRVRYERGTPWLSVSASTYRAVRRDDRAELRTWHGSVVRMVVHGHRQSYLAPAESAMLWRMAGAWALLGLVVGSLAVHRKTYAGFFAAGWLLLTFSAVAITDGVLFGSLDTPDLIVFAALSLPGLGVLVAGWRFSPWH